MIMYQTVQVLSAMYSGPALECSFKLAFGLPDAHKDVNMVLREVVTYKELESLHFMLTLEVMWNGKQTVCYNGGVEGFKVIIL